MGRLKDLGTLLYAGAMLPALAWSVRHRQGLHRKLMRPLLTGPYQGAVVWDIQDVVYEYERGELSHEAFITRVNQRMCAAVENGELDAWLKQPVGPDENRDIVLARCLGYAPLRWWYLKVHYMAKDNVHGLHAHRNVLSTQVVASGSLHVQEFDLEGSLDANPTRLRQRTDAVVGAVNGFITTDDVCNVHGFAPVETPAVRFQFYLRGHTGVKAMLRPRRGRLYVHLDGEPAADGSVTATLGRAGKAGES
ncbi:hypothetical protein [Thioalkalivibrio sp. ALJ24]|uniref:hypothetical protein n=1 Tax=Thioalkalivibrio sp. ALJ24 TaxID=545276 RepID=UPI00036094AF|nr:hypothetical protein [Thioalkalivibrio sp. ALJ24]